MGILLNQEKKMEFHYTCRNSNCCYPGKDEFKMTIDEQAVMDDNNMATVFCPFCKKEMTPSFPAGQDMPPDKDLSGNVH